MNRNTLLSILLALGAVVTLLILSGVTLLILSGCIEQTNLTTTGDNTGGGGQINNALDGIRITPSQFELQNGQQATATVVGFVGGVEVRDFQFQAAIGPNQTVATIISISGNVILFKAENPGNTALRVSAGDAEAEAQIKVVPAD